MQCSEASKFAFILCKTCLGHLVSNNVIQNKFMIKQFEIPNMASMSLHYWLFFQRYLRFALRENDTKGGFLNAFRP